MRLILGPACVSNHSCRYTPHSLNKMMHWRQKYAWNNAWKDAVIAAAAYNPERTRWIKFGTKIVLVEIYTIRKMDLDNAYGSVKPIIDGLRYANIIDDDSEDAIDLKVVQHKVDHRAEQRVELSINYAL